jgi:hypothetical protein
MSNSDGNDRPVLIELTASEARNAKIAGSKEGMDGDNPAIEELDNAFADDVEDMPSGKMRFMADPVELSKVAMKAQKHGKMRRKKGHSASQSKYYSVGDKIESQLVRQGAWCVDTGIDRSDGGGNDA